MATAPPVSVVVPAYNNAQYIARTIESVLGQSFTDLELLIADHGSRDSTWEIINSYTHDSRVRVMRTEPGGGAQRNWNRVTDEARGEAVKLVCGDDVLYPTCIAEQLKPLQEGSEVALVACRRDVRDANDGLLLPDRGLPGLAGHVAGWQAIRATVRAGTNIFGEPACVLFRAEALRRAGGWSPTAEYLIDLDMYVRVLQMGDMWAIPRPLAAFRVSSTQWSVALARAQASQTVELFRGLRASDPALVSGLDLMVGATRAYALGAARRAAYLWWGRRLKPSR